MKKLQNFFTVLFFFLSMFCLNSSIYAQETALTQGYLAEVTSTQKSDSGNPQPIEKTGKTHRKNYTNLQQEAFLDFDIHIKVEEDASLQVTEKIRIMALGRVFKRGITRSYFKDVLNSEGIGAYSFELLSVKHNGKDSPYLKTGGTLFADAVNLRTGEQDVLLEHGIHEYEIRYRTKGHVLLGEEYDNIYYNVLDHIKDLPIYSARVTVELPNDSSPLMTEVHTGKLGENTHNYKEIESLPIGTRFGIDLKNSLQRDEGLTLFMAWEKGLVHNPSHTLTVDENKSRIKEYKADVYMEEGATLRVKEKILFHYVASDIPDGSKSARFFERYLEKELYQQYTNEIVSVKLLEAPQKYKDNFRSEPLKHEVNGLYYDKRENLQYIPSKEILESGDYLFEIEYLTKGHMRNYNDAQTIHFTPFNYQNSFLVEKLDIKFHVPQEQVSYGQGVRSWRYNPNAGIVLSGKSHFKIDSPLGENERVVFFLKLKPNTVPQAYKAPKKSFMKGQDYVLEQHNHINVNEDGTLLVTQRFKVQKHKETYAQSYRVYLPLLKIISLDGEEATRMLSYDVVSVTRDGVPLKFTTYGFTDSYEVRFEDADDVFAGWHNYELIYKADGHLYDKENFDSLEFSITPLSGFYTENLEVEINLPSKVQLVEASASSVSLKNVNEVQTTQAEIDAQNANTGNSKKLVFQTDELLHSEDDFTITIAMEKGAFGHTFNYYEYFSARPYLVYPVPILVLLYCYIVNYFYRSKYKKIIIPLFKPTEGLTPSLAGSIYKREVSHLMLTADILWLAVHNFLKLSEDSEKQLCLTKTNPSNKGMNSWIYEKASSLTQKYCAEDSYVIDKKDKKMADIYSAMRKEYFKYSSSHFYWYLIPIILSQVALYFISHSAMVLLAFLCILPFTLFLGFVGLFVGLLGILSFVGYSVYSGDLILAYDVVLLAIPSYFLWRHSSHLSKEGVEIEADVLGLRQYICMAVQDRLKLVNAPQMDVATYESILPYAVALDCAEEWEKYFEKYLEETMYEPSWTTISNSHSEYRDRHRYGVAFAIATATASTVSASIKGYESSLSSSSGSGSSSGGGGGSGGGSSGGGSGGGSSGGW